MEPLVEISGLSKSFGKHLPLALDHITAQIPKGSIVGLAGPDGAGKTTLIRLIGGLLLPTAGSISVAGYDTVKAAESIHAISGYMPQKFGLYEDLTVQQNLNLYADLTGVVGAERRERFAKLLDFTSLEPFKDRLGKNLSGGMKQKLGLACALIRKPELLLLDEPSVGVDPLSRRELWKIMEDLLREDITILWSTAYLDEAERCNFVLLLNAGQLLYHGTPQAMTERVKSRVFKITHITDIRRQVLTQTLQNPHVIDAVIEGADVRVVFKSLEDPALGFSALNLEKGQSLEPALPRFEDAFVDILGGGPGGRSLLAESTPVIEAQKRPVIEAKALTKKFGSFTAAHQITLSVKSGEVFGLLGPNGAGKSTTFKLLCGLLTPTSGQAFVNGLDLQVASGLARSHIGYMAQKFSLYGNLSVQQNLDFFSGIYNLTGKKRSQAIGLMVEIFNLGPYLNTSADALPLGFKQRLALSCSVMHHPPILFLDEPTAGVDPITRREFWTHINGLVNKGTTVMVTTHFMDEAEFCDRIGLVYQSNLIEIGTPDELKAQAKSAALPSPTLEDAFIYLIQRYGSKGPAQNASERGSAAPKSGLHSGEEVVK